MTVTRLGDPQPLLTLGYGRTTNIPDGGTSGQIVTSNGSNGAVWGENVARITANGSNANTLLGPFVNFAAGSNVSLSTGSNTLTIHSATGIIDHGGLTGLLDDDHTQYLETTNGGGDVVHAHGNTGSTETINPALGNVHTLTLDANCTFTLTAPASGPMCTLELYLTQDGVGSRTVTWPASVSWPGGTTPTLSSTAAAVDRFLLETRDGGTVWYGIQVGGAAASLIVKDEGVALSTPATSLDFVGAGVTASGTGAAKTITVTAATPLTTKGDLYTRSTVDARLAVGSNATGVIADSVEATGIRWTTQAIAGEVLMADGVTAPPVPIETEAQDDWLYADL